MNREKTELEKSETPQEQADRLREALFLVTCCEELDTAQHIAKCAIGGERHGSEIPRPDLDMLKDKMF